MSVTINASTSSGLVQTADTSGIIELQNNGTTAVTISSSNLQFNSGYGSVATAYGCRAWVNFNGTGTVAIRASGNVTSITDNGTGDYTVNFTTAMPNVNYAPVIGCAAVGTNLYSASLDSTAVAVGSFRFITVNASSTLVDSSVIVASVFR